MQTKEERINYIKEVLVNNIVRSQDELMLHLNQGGFDCTQATLSRDLKQLHATKSVNSNGVYCIKLPDENIKSNDNIKETLKRGFESVLWIGFSSNNVLIKTAIAYANPVATIIDIANLKCILGTIAGDDTIIVVLKNGYNSKDFEKEIATIDEDILKKIKY